MNKFESASILAGMSPNEEPQVSEPTNLHVITGEVVANSENGTVLVSMDGLVFSEDDTQYIEMDTIGGLEEGDEATIILAGEAGSSMTPLAIGSTGSVDRLSARVIETELLLADKASIDDLEAATARIGDLEADHVSVDTLEAATARIENLEVDHVSISDFEVEQANIDNLQAATADIDTIRANSAKVQNLTAAQLEADHATIGTLDTTYMHANMSNADVAWIQNGTIKNGAIVSAMINDVSANKLTAGTINGSVINVTNLNADNITTGTINGQRIGEGSLSLDKLSEDVYTEAEVNTIVDGLNDRIDGAIETHTGTAVPTLNNAPASSWNTTKLRDEHVGDVYYVVNSQSQQNGYCYRFTKSGSTYSWQLIKDSDVTAALSRLTTAEGKITTFDSDISTLKTDTGTLTTKTTSLETRMSDAESDILDKVDTTTFNEVSDTVDSHSQSITQMATTLSNKADSSTVTAVTNRVSKNEQDISGINTTIGELQETVESKADGSTVSTISNKLNTVSDTVDGHTQTLTSVQNTLSTKADSSTVSTLSTKVNTIEDTVDGHTQTISGQSTILSNNGLTSSTNITNRVSSVEQDLSGYKTTVSETYATQTALATTNGNVTAAQTAADNAQAAADRANGRQVAYSATSSTGASTAAKVAACTNFPTLAAGATVTVRFSAANTSTGAVTLNVNSTGAKTVYVNGAATSSSNQLLWGANANITFTYDGSYWRVDSEPRTWYGTGSVAAATAAKTATINEVVICKGTTVVLNMTNENTSTSATLNVTSTGAKNIYYGTTTTRPTTANGYGWSAGSTVSLTFDGRYWRIGDTTALARLTAAESTISSHTTSISQNASAIALKADSSTTYTKTDVDGLISTEVTNRNAAITAATDAIELSVSETYSTKTETAEISDRIVGRNLLRGTKDATADSWYLYNSTVPENGVVKLTPTTSTAYACYTVRYLDFSEYNDATYTVSLDVRRLEGSYTNKRLRIIYGFNTAARIGAGFSSTKGDASDRFGSTYIAANEIGTDWTRLSVTFSVPDDLNTGSINALVTGSQLTVEPYLESSGNPVEIRNLKLEKGTVATEWSAAPEDYTDEQVTEAKAAIKVTTDGITTEVAKKVNGTEIISSINQSAETVKIQASKVEITGEAVFNAINNDTGTTTINGGKIDADTVHVKAANIDGTLTASQINASGLTIGQTQVTGLTTALNGKADTSDIPTNVSDLTNDSGFQTSSQVESAITGKGYQTSSQVNTAITSKGYQTSTQVESAITSKGYATTTQAQGYATTAKTEAISAAATDATTKANAAAKTATSYVTEITGQNGIMVHPSTDDDTGVRITSDVDILRNGYSVINVGTQGDTSGNTDAGVTIYDGTTNENVVATFDGDGIGLVGGAFRLTSERVTEEYGDESNPTTSTEIRSTINTEASNDSYATRCFLRSGLTEGDAAGGGFWELASETDINPEFPTDTKNASVEVGSDPWGSSIRLVADSQELSLSKNPVDNKDYFTLTSEVFLLTDYHNGVNMWSTVPGTVLWSGGWHMTAGHTANLKYNVSTCPTGIVLHFQPYTSSTVKNYNHIYHFVPKTHVASYNGTGIVVRLGNPDFSNMASKYLYISNDHITGNDLNNTSGTNSGITYNNAAWVMTQVIAV